MLVIRAKIIRHILIPKFKCTVYKPLKNEPAPVNMMFNSDNVQYNVDKASNVWFVKLLLNLCQEPDKPKVQFVFLHC